MKRKIYFIITSIIGVIVSILTIIYSKNIINNLIESSKELYSKFPKDFQDRIINILSHSGLNFIRLSSVIVIIISIIILIYSLKNKINSKKNTFLVLSIISFVLSNFVLMQLAYLISIILSATIKQENMIKVKKEMPKLEYKKSNKKDITKCIILFLLYFSQFIVSKFLPNDKTIIIIYEVSFYLIMFVMCFIFYFNTLKNDFIIFKNNFSAYLKYIIPRYLIGMAIFIVVNLISILLTKKATSVNQGTLESISIWQLLPLAVIWAPIVEEIIYRANVRKILNNNVIFILVSSILFGYMHVIHEANLFNIIISGLPYTVFGATLAYIYFKTNNICSNIFVHFLQNSISCLMLFLI